MRRVRAVGHAVRPVAHCCPASADKTASAGVSTKLELFGIFDGHGGKQAAQYTAKHLASQVLHCFHRLFCSRAVPGC